MEEREADAAVMRTFPARMAKIAVTGNHEAYHGPEQSLAFIERSGFRILRAETLEIGGIRIVGVDDDTFAKAAESDTADAGPLLRGLEPGRFWRLMTWLLPSSP